MKDYSVLDELVPKTEELHRAMFDKGYEQGMDNAWECAKKITLNFDHGGMSSTEIKAVFGLNHYGVMLDYTASEAIEKIKAWEQTDDIKVGDEVSVKNTNDFVIVSRILEDGTITGFGGYGQMYSGLSQERVAKTGNHYDGIEKILKKVRGEG